MNQRFTTKLLLMLSVILFITQAAFSQEGMVKGTVYDANDGNTLPGATILIVGTTIGTVTDINGKYSIMVEPDASLRVSFIGYNPQEFIVQPNTTFDIRLEPTATALDEFIVIGYGEQKKDDATGSVTALGTKDFNTGAITSPTQLISGKVAGVQITDGGGAPGEGATIRIRGGSSLQAINDPLVVIDGVPVESDGISGMRNPLNAINPNDIESISILKDASATAIYGSRASNGVIIVTTKKAKADGTGKKFPMHFEYSGNFSLSTPTRTKSVFTANEYKELIHEKHPNRVNMMGDASMDWQDKIFRPAGGMGHYIALSGKAAFLPYRFSLGYDDKNGILKTDNMKRTTLGLNLNPTFLDDHLSVNANANYMHVNNRFADRGAIGAAIQFDPTQAVKDGNERFGGYYFWKENDGNPIPYSPNPVALLEQREDKSNVNRFIGSAILDYKLHWLPELRAKLNLGMDYSKADGTVLIDTTAAFNYDPQHGGGTNNKYEQEKRNELLEFYLNYVKDINSINSKIDFMAGYSWQHNYRKNYSINSNFVKTPELTDTIDDPTEYYLLSYFGRLNYTFMDKYILTLTLRNDNTSRFSKENRQGWFPSAALAWKIHKEGFMKNLEILSQLKLRLSYGVTGQQNIGEGNYPYLARYTFNRAGAYYQMGNVFYRTLRPEGYDANIKWEETSTYNAGLDFGFADNRYYGSVDVYYRKTTDLLNIIPVPAGTNLTNEILTNIGDMENKGIEFSIFTRPYVRPDILWEIGFNATLNRNEITKLTASSDSSYLGSPVGNIGGGVGNKVQMHSVGYPSFSYFVYEQVYDENGKPIEGVYVDRNGDGEITDDDRYHYKSPHPDFTIGLSSKFIYKSWDFSFSGRAQFGNYVYNNVESNNANYERLYRSEGPYLSNITSDVTDTDFESAQYLSDYYIQDGSFFRMDYISLGYNFEKLINETTSLRLSFTVNNAFIISKYKGLDPEIFGGIDNNVYPRPRTFVLGVNLQF